MKEKSSGDPKAQVRKGLDSVFGGSSAAVPVRKSKPQVTTSKEVVESEKNPMGRPPLFDEPTKIKAINQPISFLVNLQRLADKRQGKKPRGGNVSELIRELIQPIIDEEFGAEQCKPNDYPDWFRV